MTVEAVSSPVSVERRPRRRLPAGWTADDFIDWADTHNAKYVILRWFDALPGTDSEDDIDILVSDDSVELVLSILEAKSTVGVPCDVYSASGRLGTKYKGVPYYPPHLAKEILEHATRHQGRVPAPDRLRYFYSLAFHAVYHKGRRSDLSRGHEEKRSDTSLSAHSHFDTLIALRDELGIDVSINFRSLADFLRDNSWEPGLDLLRKLGESNGWVKQLYQDRTASRPRIDGLGVFVLRNWAVRKGWTPAILVHLQKSGFVILAVHELVGEREAVARQGLRGGNWGSSREYPVNSGGPAALITVLDTAPLAVAKRDRRKYPHMSNGRIIAVKRELRAMMNKGRPEDRLVNSLHTSDDEAEAVYYLELIVPETLPAVRRLSAKLHKERIGALGRFARKVLPRPVKRTIRQLAQMPVARRVLSRSS